MKFFIISPGYKCDEWAPMHIGSIDAQINKNFHHIIIDDDASTNPSILKACNNRTVVRNETRLGPMGSHIKGVLEAELLGITAQDVIVHLDLDDWLLHPYIFNILEQVYEKDMWATYGNYISSDGAASICRPLTRKYNRATREWNFSHLRTFRYGLWKKINKEDFKDQNGNLFSCAADVAICAPIQELCPIEKICFIPMPLVYYNRITYLNESKVDLNKVSQTYEIISKRKPYTELKNYD